MISKQLARQLKDAGFVQKSTAGYIPDLYDLIEECGDGLFSLSRNDSGKWRAHIERESLGYNTEDFDTPDESVVELWLKINNKLN